MKKDSKQILYEGLRNAINRFWGYSRSGELSITIAVPDGSEYEISNIDIRDYYNRETKKKDRNIRIECELK